MKISIEATRASELIRDHVRGMAERIVAEESERAISRMRTRLAAEALESCVSFAAWREELIGKDVVEIRFVGDSGGAK